MLVDNVGKAVIVLSCGLFSYRLLSYRTEFIKFNEARHARTLA